MSAAGPGLARAAAVLAAAVAAAALLSGVTAPDAEGLVRGWQGSLVPLAICVAWSRPGAARAAVRAFAACGVADLALLAGLGLASARGPSTVAAALVATGALARLGAAPFQGWSVEVAERAHPLAAAFVAAAGKLAGAALLLRFVVPGAPSGAVRSLAAVGAATVATSLVLAASEARRGRRVAHLSAAHSGAVVLAAALAPAIALPLAAAGAALVLPALLAVARGAPATAPLLPAPVARAALAAERGLEPGVVGRGLVDALAAVLFVADRAVNAVHDVGVAGASRAGSRLVRRAHDGSHATYLAWSMLGFAAIVLYLVGGHAR